MKVFVVHHDFTHQPKGDDGAAATPIAYARGQMIKDPAEIQAVQDAGQGHFGAMADVDDSFFAEPAPAADAKSPKAAPAADPAQPE